MSDRIDAQIAFLSEADRLKSVNRANMILDGSRAENSAEHSWHLALYALVLAPLAGEDVDIARAIRMLLLHDLVEIDAGDHPIHLETDWDAVARAERAAADRLFGLLPADQGAEFLTLWLEFEADKTPTARFAKRLDRCQPIFQTICADAPVPEHVDVVRGNLAGGRAAGLEQDFLEAWTLAHLLLENPKADLPKDPLADRLPFLLETDHLKTVLRASRLADNSRRENSAEHSWHVVLYALVMGEHAATPIDVDRAIAMLLLHDIVEIDAGDNPIHGHVDQAEMEAKELAAADRLYGLLPAQQGAELRAIWDEFEAAQSPDARFAKAIDRVQVPVLNLANGGGTWSDYRVTFEQLETRVGTPVKRGAPALWDWLTPRLHDWFDGQKTA